MDSAVEIIELLPEGWSAKSRLRSGGQANVTVVRHRDGPEGIFRVLKEPVTPTSRERFRREIKILSGRVQHRSVVRILEWSSDVQTPWYIGELGDSFETWWRRWKGGDGRTPDDVARKAVWTTRELASALAVCHREGIVHRDVKPKNIVVKRGEADPWPILIDFGIAYDEGVPRLTPTGDAVGNARFSPDVMRNRVEDVRAWLDVFELGQMLIWMLDEEAPKSHWQRPVHWKHARYSSDIGNDMLMSIRAFTAACSTESVAPRDGAECIQLLNTLFAGEREAEESEEVKSGTIARAKRRGAAKRLLVEQVLAAEIEASAPHAEAVYAELRHAVLAVCTEIREEEPSLAIDVDEEFHYELAGATDLLWLRVGAGKVNIQLRVKCKVVPWSEPGPAHKSNVEFWRKYLPRDAICFTFAIEGGVVAAHSTKYLQGRWLTILRNGGICLHPLNASFGRFKDNDLGGSANGDGRAATIAEVRKFAASVLTDEKYWTYVAAVG